ncbi:head-tail joining protein [Metapseudomonas sp. CR1201]
MAGFSDLVEDMDEQVMSSLGDGEVDYLDAMGNTMARGISVIVDRNLEQVGPDGRFLTDAVGVTWRKAFLPSVERGGVFIFCRERFVVETPIADDGHMITVACQVQL